LSRVRGLAATDALPRGIEELEQSVRTRRRVLRVRVPRGLMLNEPRKRVPLLTAAPSELLSRVLDDLLDRPLVRNRRAAAPEVEQGSGLLLEPVDSARDRLLARTHDRVLGKLALARDLVHELFHQARERIQQAKPATRTLEPGRRALVFTLAHTKVRTTTHVEVRVVVVT